MTKRVLWKYFLYSLPTALFIWIFFYLNTHNILYSVIAMLLVILFSIFSGLAFVSSMSLIMEHLEEILSSIRIESAVSFMPTSEPLFEVERGEEEV